MLNGNIKKFYKNCAELALSRERDLLSQEIQIIRKVGSLDMAAMCGVMVFGAEKCVPVILDGAITLVAAYAAVVMNEAIRDFLIPSHASTEKVSEMILAKLEFSPLIHGEFHLGEGTGALLIYPMLKMGAAVFKNMITFHEAEMIAYKKKDEV